MSERKTGIALSYLSILLANVIGLVYTPFLLRMLGQSEYGLYALAGSVISYLSVMDFGFGNATVRYTSLYRGRGDETKLPGLWGMLLIVYGVISLFSLAIGGILSFNSHLIFSNSMATYELTRIRLLLLLMTFNIGVSFPLSVFESIMVAYERFKIQRILQIMRTLLQPIIMIPLLLMGHKSVSLVVLITLLNLLYLLTNLWYCFRKIKIRVYFQQVDIPLLKEILHYSWWVFLIMIVDRLYWSTGQIILGAYVGTSAVAVFAIAIQFKNYFTTFSTAISTVFLPKMASLTATSEFNHYFIKVGRSQFLIIAFVLSGFILFGESFIILWAGNDYRNAYFIALIILIPLSVPLVQTLGMSILQAQNRLKFRSYTYLFMAVVCCVMSIPLARLYGGLGCAISISFSLILCNILIMNIYYHKKIKLDIPNFWREIIRMSLPVLLVDLVVYAILNWLELTLDWGLLFIAIVMFTILYLAVVYKWSMNSFEKSMVTNLLGKFIKLS